MMAFSVMHLTRSLRGLVSSTFLFNKSKSVQTIPGCFLKVSGVSDEPECRRSTIQNERKTYFIRDPQKVDWNESFLYAGARRALVSNPPTGFPSAPPLF